MLESKTNDSNNPSPSKHQQQESTADAHDSNLLSEVYTNKRNWYLPSDPLGIKYADKIWYIFKYGKTPYYIHITFPIYIISTLIFSLCHTQPHYWLALYILLLLFQIIAISLQTLLSLYIANKFDATIYRIILWPYGSIGYASDYKQWTHFFIVEYSVPFLHILIFLLFWGISAIAKISSWNNVLPMDQNFGRNLLNGIWVTNIIIASLHICIPVYSMKVARLMVNYLYRKRTHRDVAQLIILPSGFMTIILLIFGIVDGKPLPLFLSLCTIYQTYLLWDGNRKNLVAKLPLFQLLEDSLRNKRGRKKNSVNVGQRNRKEIDILTQEAQNNPNNKQNIVPMVGGKKKKRKMSTLDEDEEYEPNIKKDNVEQKLNDLGTASNITRAISDESNDDEQYQNPQPMEDKVVEKQQDMLQIDMDQQEKVEVVEIKDKIEANENKEDMLKEKEKGDKPKKEDASYVDLNVNDDENVDPNVDTKEDGGNEDVEKVKDDKMDVPKMIELEAQKTGDSGVMVNGAESVDPEYEMIDVPEVNQADSNSGTPLGSSGGTSDFVDIMNES